MIINLTVDQQTSAQSSPQAPADPLATVARLIDELLSLGKELPLSHRSGGWPAFHDELTALREHALSPNFSVLLMNDVGCPLARGMKSLFLPRLLGTDDPALLLPGADAYVLYEHSSEPECSVTLRNGVTLTLPMDGVEEFVTKHTLASELQEVRIAGPLPALADGLVVLNTPTLSASALAVVSELNASPDVPHLAPSPSEVLPDDVAQWRRERTASVIAAADVCVVLLRVERTNHEQLFAFLRGLPLTHDHLRFVLGSAEPLSERQAEIHLRLITYTLSEYGGVRRPEVTLLREAGDAGADFIESILAAARGNKVTKLYLSFLRLLEEAQSLAQQDTSPLRRVRLRRLIPQLEELHRQAEAAVHAGPAHEPRTVPSLVHAAPRASEAEPRPLEEERVSSHPLETEMHVATNAVENLPVSGPASPDVVVEKVSTPRDGFRKWPTVAPEPAASQIAQLPPEPAQITPEPAPEEAPAVAALPDPEEAPAVAAPPAPAPHSAPLQPAPEPDVTVVPIFSSRAPDDRPSATAKPAEREPIVTVTPIFSSKAQPLPTTEAAASPVVPPPTLESPASSLPSPTVASPAPEARRISSQQNTAPAPPPSSIAPPAAAQDAKDHVATDHDARDHGVNGHDAKGQEAESRRPGSRKLWPVTPEGQSGGEPQRLAEPRPSAPVVPLVPVETAPAPASAVTGSAAATPSPTPTAPRPVQAPRSPQRVDRALPAAARDPRPAAGRSVPPLPPQQRSPVTRRSLLAAALVGAIALGTWLTFHVAESHSIARYDPTFHDDGAPEQFAPPVDGDTLAPPPALKGVPKPSVPVHPSHVPNPAPTPSGTGATGGTALAPAAAITPDAAAAPQSASSQTPEASSAAPGGSEPSLDAALNHWISTYRSENIDAQLACYAPRVNTYFNWHDVTPAQIRYDKRRAWSRIADLREYRVTPISVTDIGHDRRAVLLQKDWDATTTRGTIFQGSEIEKLVFALMNDQWKIVDEQELKVLRLRRE